MLMMTPERWRTMIQAARCEQRKAPFKFTPSSRSHQASSPSRKWRPMEMSPALFTSTSTVPKSLERPVEDAVHLDLAGDVGNHTHRLRPGSPDRFHHRLGVRDLDVIHHDSRPLHAEALGHRAPNALSRPAHDDHLPPHPLRLSHGPLLLVR
jgi:hypothetical protein